jgi:hypothetical protein
MDLHIKSGSYVRGIEEPMTPWPLGDSLYPYVENMMPPLFGIATAPSAVLTRLWLVDPCEYPVVPRTGRLRSAILRTAAILHPLEGSVQKESITVRQEQ